MRKIFIFLIISCFTFSSCDEMQQIASHFPTETGEGIGGVSGL
jgi:hypothetical protein